MNIHNGVLLLFIILSGSLFSFGPVPRAEENNAYVSFTSLNESKDLKKLTLTSGSDEMLEGAFGYIFRVTAIKNSRSLIHSFLKPGDQISF